MKSAVVACFGLAHAALKHHLNPTMPYVISNPAPGHEGESREFASAATYFEVGRRRPRPPWPPAASGLDFDDDDDGGGCLPRLRR